MYAEALIVGRLTKDPVPFTANGKEFARITIAVNPAKDVAHFFDVIANEKLQEEVMKLRKGELVFAVVTPNTYSSVINGAIWESAEKADSPVKVTRTGFRLQRINKGDFIEVRLKGTLAETPTVEYLPNGNMKVCTFRVKIAGNRDIMKRVAWYGISDEAAKYATDKNPGDPVMVVGHLTQSEYEYDGQTRVVERIIAYRVSWLPVPRDRSAVAETVQDVENELNEAEAGFESASNVSDEELESLFNM